MLIVFAIQKRFNTCTHVLLSYKHWLNFILTYLFCVDFVFRVISLLLNHSQPLKPNRFTGVNLPDLHHLIPISKSRQFDAFRVMGDDAYMTGSCIANISKKGDSATVSERGKEKSLLIDRNLICNLKIRKYAAI
jgi:hypothetical protein